MKKLKWSNAFWEFRDLLEQTVYVIVGSWKLTEIKLVKKWMEAWSDTRWETQGEKREKTQRAPLADSEKCCKLTDPFLKSSAASASTSANTASTNVSDTAEPAHRGERQDREEDEPEEDNCVTVRHVFIMERLALMIHSFVLCIVLVQLFIAC